MLEARAIKSEDEINCLKMAAAITDGVWFQDLRSTTIELWCPFTLPTRRSKGVHCGQRSFSLDRFSHFIRDFTEILTFFIKRVYEVFAFYNYRVKT